MHARGSRVGQRKRNDRPTVSNGKSAQTALCGGGGVLARFICGNIFSNSNSNIWRKSRVREDIINSSESALPGSSTGSASHRRSCSIIQVFASKGDHQPVSDPARAAFAKAADVHAANAAGSKFKLICCDSTVIYPPSRSLADCQDGDVASIHVKASLEADGGPSTRSHQREGARGARAFSFASSASLSGGSWSTARLQGYAATRYDPKEHQILKSKDTATAPV
ncbi:hypothetical protein JKP88DRAFT_246659 [Tribonema minus]|uniref:Uncharacterized protein n=1 Tax=Tribonema minus TaxID=303371 RepID=A0A835YU29_9STRA|nr:hypothetical protein JKP88DRAFT_246659 [Tribonema minus]